MHHFHAIYVLYNNLLLSVKSKKDNTTSLCFGWLSPLQELGVVVRTSSAGVLHKPLQKSRRQKKVLRNRLCPTYFSTHCPISDVTTTRCKI